MIERSIKQKTFIRPTLEYHYINMIKWSRCLWVVNRTISSQFLTNSPDIFSPCVSGFELVIYKYILWNLKLIKMSSKKKETTSEPAFDLEQQFILKLPPVSILQNIDYWNDRYEQGIGPFLYKTLNRLGTTPVWWFDSHLVVKCLN